MFPSVIFVSIDRLSQAKDVLIRCAGTALNSKLISSQKDLFAPMVVEAVSNLDQQLLALSLVSACSLWDIDG